MSAVETRDPRIESSHFILSQLLLKEKNRLKGRLQIAHYSQRIDISNYFFSFCCAKSWNRKYCDFYKRCYLYFFKLSIHGLFFFIFVVSIPTVDSKQKDVRFKSSPMTGFEPWTSGIGNDHSTNWATTSVTRFGDLLDLWQLFKAWANN